jgi:hypothetical protein
MRPANCNVKLSIAQRCISNEYSYLELKLVLLARVPHMWHTIYGGAP